MSVKEATRVETTERDGEVWGNRYVALDGSGETWGPEEFENEVAAHLANIMRGVNVGGICRLPGIRASGFRYIGPRIKRRG